MTPVYQGACWLEANGKELSPLGRDVANILGAAYRGIYHIDRAVLHKRVDWSSRNVIVVVVYGEVSTVDGDVLSQLFVRCANKKIRLTIRGKSVNYLCLQFTRGNGMFCGYAGDASLLMSQALLTGDAE